MDREEFIRAFNLGEADQKLTRMGSSAYKIFISWCSWDKDKTIRVVNYLKLFFGTERIYFSDITPPGPDFQDSIRMEIRKCDVVLLFLSCGSYQRDKEAKDDDFTQLKELKFAKKQNKTIIYVPLEPQKYILEQFSTIDTKTGLLWSTSPKMRHWVPAQNYALHESIAAAFVEYWCQRVPGVEPDGVRQANKDPHELIYRIEGPDLLEATKLTDWLESNHPNGKNWSVYYNGQPDLRVLSPILGTGTLHLGRKEVLDLDEALNPKRLVNLCPEDCGGEGSPEKCPVVDLGELRKFAAALVEGRRDRRKVKYSAEALKELTGLRIALLKLAMMSNKILMTSLAQEGRHVGNWEKQPVELTPEDRRILVCLVQSAIEALGQGLLAGNEPGRAVGSRESGIRLVMLAPNAIMDQLEILLEAFQDWQRKLEASDIRWFADAFWHTMIFSLPLYPRTSELLFQVRLIHQDEVGGGFNKSHSDGQPWAIPANRDLREIAKAVRACMSRGFAPGPREQNEGFFARIAEALWSDWDRLRKRVANNSKGSRIPMAFATTFDFELEAALARWAVDNRGPEQDHLPVFHVIMPIVEVPAGAQVGQWSWVVLTLDAKEFVDWTSGQPGQVLMVPRKWDKVGTYPQFPENYLAGPVVVRLNGTPYFNLTQVPPSSRSGGQNPFGRATSTSVDPYVPLAVSDYDLIQFLMMDMQSGLKLSVSQEGAAATIGWPVWLFNEFTSTDRFWLAMGVGMSNWSSRLYLFVHTARAANTSIVAINREIEWDRAAFLSGCGIRAVAGDLFNPTGIPSLLDKYSKQVRGRASTGPETQVQTAKVRTEVANV